MIVSDDKACRLPASIAHEGEPPVVVGRMVQVPYPIVPVYAALLIALGWFAGEQWRNPLSRQRWLCRWRMRHWCQWLPQRKRGEAGSRCGT